MTNPNQTTYALKCVSRNGTLIAGLDDAILTGVRWELNGPGFIKYNLSQNSRFINYPVDNSNEIQLWINSNLSHWGFHHQSEEAPDIVKFTCPGLLQYFNFRFITNTSLYYGYASDGVTVLPTGVEQMAIAADVIQKMQVQANHSFNIGVYPYTPSGVTRYRNYKISEHKNVLNDILSEFPTLGDALGNPTGFDFDIDINSQPGNRLFRPYYPSRGSQITSLRLEYGRNIIDYLNKIDGSRQENEVWYTGGNNGDITFENHATITDATNLATYGIWQGVKSQSNENDVNTLLGLAQREIAKYKKPLQAPSVTAVEVPDSLLGKINPGDWVWVKIVHGRTNVNGYYRVQYLEWLPGPGNLKIGFADQ